MSMAAADVVVVPNSSEPLKAEDVWNLLKQKMSSCAIVVEVLSQNNYEQWSAQVKTYLMAKDVWDVVEATTEPPKAEDGEAEFKVWKKKNAKALHAIQISCGTQMLSFITAIGTAKVAWDTLEKKFNTTSPPENTGHYHDAMEEWVLDEDLEIQATNGYENDDNDFDLYLPFFDYIVDGNWEAAKEFLTRHPKALRVRSPPPWRATALHEAVRNEHVHIVKELVKKMTDEDLEIKDADGDTAFRDAVYSGITEMAQCMVEKNKKLLGIRIFNYPDNITPVLKAYCNGHFEMARYLYSVTPLEDLNGTDGAELITRCFFTKSFDLAWDLIQRCPNLTITENYKGQSPLYTLAGMRSAFLSGSRLTLCEQWIYNSIYIPSTRIIDREKESTPSIDREKETTPSINDISIDVQKLENYQDDNQRDLVCSGRSLFQRLVTNLLEVLGIFNHIYKMKSTHIRVLEFLHIMCEVITQLEIQDDTIIQKAIFQAIEGGHIEFITRICKAMPSYRDLSDTKRRTIFQYAVECRQEKVYSLIYGLDYKERDLSASYLSEFDNSILHTAASLSLATAVQGAALQMQRELHWFKEVESIVPARVHEFKNDTDRMTAHELFTKNHKELVKEGEKSMKDTATSCTVVGALIVTIMFAAAFTVPGGNNGDTGVPVFLYKKVFMVFIVSDAISLFSSTTSVMIFLGILTSRYAENDFLKSLPTKMILGLFSLFLSIATMMIAFSSALFIMLHDQSWIVIPIILLASVPVTSFMWMQFPFLAEILISTYGSGIFDKKVTRWY